MKKQTDRMSTNFKIYRLNDLRRRGFTLIELLVAMTISAIVFAVAWKFFESSANTSREVTATAQSLDEARAALDELSKHLQMAGAEGSPNSLSDPRVQPKARNSTVGIITGIYAYQDWQANRIYRETGSIIDAADPIMANNTQAVFNGVVVMGAHSYPLPFEAQFTNESLNELNVPATPRGRNRLANPNPFVVNNSGARNLLDSTLDPQWPTRILRITDSDGFKQFAQITGSNGAASTITVTPAFMGRGSGRNYGIEVASGALDRNYDVAALDLYWYYVRQDPNDATNLQLVRDRLCASTFLNSWTSTGPAVNPRDFLAGGSCGDRELTILANRVASFDIWFDCGQPSGTGSVVYPVSDVAPAAAWNNVDNSCLTQGPAGQLERARLAHALLALYAKNERREMTDSTGYLQNGRLLYFDANNSYPGASPVTILQSDVFMRNFLYW